MSYELPQADFDKLRQWAPLISIDLIIQDQQGRVLLGRRSNEPARGFWFVPGGRIRKDERLADAFARIVSHELGIGDARALPSFSSAAFVGVFEHHYPATPTSEPPCSIHYVVLAYRIVLDDLDISSLPTAQHEAWQWFETRDAVRDHQVHENTKAYFRPRS